MILLIQLKYLITLNVLWINSIMEYNEMKYMSVCISLSLLKKSFRKFTMNKVTVKLLVKPYQWSN